MPIVRTTFTAVDESLAPGSLNDDAGAVRLTAYLRLRHPEGVDAVSQHLQHLRQRLVFARLELLLVNGEPVFDQPVRVRRSVVERLRLNAFDLVQILLGVLFFLCRLRLPILRWAE